MTSSIIFFVIVAPNGHIVYVSDTLAPGMKLDCNSYYYYYFVVVVVVVVVVVIAIFTTLLMFYVLLCIL